MLAKLEVRFRSRPPHAPDNGTQGLEEPINSIETKHHRGIHKDMLNQPLNTNSSRDKRDNTAHMVFDGEPAVKLHAKNIEVGTSANGNPREEQVTMGRVHSSGSINHY